MRARFLLLTLTAGALSAAEPFALAVRGRPADVAIVVRAAAAGPERLAARELQQGTERLTGVRLPIVEDAAALPPRAVLLGDTRFTREALGAEADVAALGDEGFRLKTAGTRLLVLGGAGRGALYGVYELLERFGGCAWYAPTFEVMPRRETLAVPADLDETQRPAFALREQSGNGAWRSDVAFAMRNKMNPPHADPALYGPSRFRFDPVLGKCHTFEALLSAREHFAAHPEWFAEVDGRRVGERTQLCLSNPEVRRLCTEKVCARIAASYPHGVRRYGVSPNDWLNYCRCARCAAIDRAEGSPTGSLIAFVNAIADEVEKQWPDVVIQTLAYSYTRRAPKTLRPRRNVDVCLCTIECDFREPLATSRARENRAVRADVARWRAGGGPLSVWDYSSDFACTQNLWPNFRALQANLAFFRDAGAEQIYELGGGGGPNDVWAQIKGWLIAQWEWNPARDREALLRRAFADHFGPAAEDLRRVFDLAHDFPRDAKRFPMRCFEFPTAAPWTPAFFDAAEALLAQAEAKARGTAYAVNVAHARLPFDYTRALRGAARPSLARPPQDASARARWTAERDAARRIVSVMDAPGGLRLSDDAAYARSHEGLLRHLAAQEAPPSTAPRRVMLEDEHLVGDFPVTRFRRVADAAAKDGRAVHLPGTGAGGIAWFCFGALALDPDGVYQPRVRVRTKKGAPGGVAFRAGVYNRRDRRSRGGIRAAAETLAGDGYAWYDLGACSPNRFDWLWVAPGWAAAADETAADVWIDRFEVVRIK